MEPIVVRPPGLSREQLSNSYSNSTKGVMAPFDECTLARPDNGHQSFLDSCFADIDKNNNISSTPKHSNGNNNNSSSSSSSRSRSSCYCSTYDPVKYLSAITVEQTIFGHSPSSTCSRQSPVLSPVKNDSIVCDSVPLVYRNSPHLFSGNNAIQSDEIICSWTESNIINHINDTDTNNNNNINDDSSISYQSDGVITMDSDPNKDICRLSSSNLNSPWGLSSTPPLHHHPSSSSSSSSSPFSLSSTVSLSSLSSSSCMQVGKTLPSGADDVMSDLSQPPPPSDCPSKTLAMNHNASLYPLTTAFLSPSSPGYNNNTQPTMFFGPPRGHSYFNVQCEKNGDIWEQDEVEEENNGIMNWRIKHPYHWSSGDVLDWLFSVSVEHGLDMKDLRAENFQNVDGSELCRMKLQDFLQLEPKFGAFMFEMLERLMCKAPCSPPDTPYSLPSVHSPGLKLEPPEYHQAHIQETSQIYTVVKPEERGQPYYSDCYTQQQCHQSSFSTPLRQQQSCCPPTATFSSQVLRRRSGRPRARTLQLDNNIRDSKDKKAKNQHLWEFIYETLMSPSHNPQFLRWENQREGIFRFVQSEAVAQLWGRRKNNDNMTYEKLSRAMRHYYRRGILERVEGRRLVYKFSLKAMDRIKNKKNSST